MDHRLKSAGNQLEVALDQYLEATVATRKSPNGRATDISRAQPSPFLEQISELDALERRLQHTKAIVGTKRNDSAAVVPIHRLPHNLLARIFRAFVFSKPCMFHQNGRLARRSIHLSHVCSHWRHIAIISPDLWSHIDVSLSVLSSKVLLSRIKTFLSRAGQSHLDLHVEYASRDDSGDDSNLKNFIAPLIPRTQRIQCRVQPPLFVSEQQISQSALSCFLNENTVPGKLTMLDISVGHTLYTFFLQTNEQKPSYDALSLNLSAHRLEELLLPITILRLSTIYPQWTSKAYHGLIELRLHTPDSFLTITESELVAILGHSPGLRVLEFGIPTKFEDTRLMPVSLHQLEVLVTHIASYRRLGRFLRLIDTGSSPLFMSVDSPYPDDELNDDIHYFFSHSNITRLCTAHFSRFYRSLELVSLAHTIKKLAISPPPIDPGALNEPGLPIQVHLDTLYLLGNMSIDINQLQGVFYWSTIQNLVLWGDVYRATRDQRPIVSEAFLKEELFDLGVDIEILSTNLPSPMDSYLL